DRGRPRRGRRHRRSVAEHGLAGLAEPAQSGPDRAPHRPLGAGAAREPRRPPSARLSDAVRGAAVHGPRPAPRRRSRRPDGVARQLVQAGVPLPSLRHIFITHHHSDHNADYGNVMLLAWTTGLRGRIDSWGPPPLEKMTRLFFEMNAYDIDTRIADEGRVPLV